MTVKKGGKKAMLKALILAGGRGRRLGDKSKFMNKCLLELNGRPVIENSLNYAVNSNVDEIVIVVSYMAEMIINRYGINHKGIPVKYVIQDETLGLVHAIECAGDTIDGADFFLMLGDEILMGAQHSKMIEKFNQENLFGLCGVVVQPIREKISLTYSIIQDDKNNIFRLIEKPKHPMNDLQGTGNCLFRNELYQYIEETPINQKRGEKELPDLIQCAIDDGRPVKSFRICDWYTNVNSEEDLAEVVEFMHQNKSKKGV